MLSAYFADSEGLRDPLCGYRRAANFCEKTIYRLAQITGLLDKYGIEIDG
jgi:hypothetical protein